MLACIRKMLPHLKLIYCLTTERVTVARLAFMVGAKAAASSSKASFDPLHTSPRTDSASLLRRPTSTASTATLSPTKCFRTALPKSIVATTAQSEDDRKSLRALAEALVAKLKECAPAIGLDIGRLTALEAQLGNLTVTSGIGARITEANVGTFKTGDISVGDPSRK